MPANEYRDLRKFEVAEYDYAKKRISLHVVYDNAEDALKAYSALLIDNDVPADRVPAIKDALSGALLRGATLYEHECLATNCRVSFIIRK